MLYYVIGLLSQIYCDGPILTAVQEGKLFPDSKHFVDMMLKNDPLTTLQNFKKLGEHSNDTNVLLQFIDQHFDEPGTELIKVYPTDWHTFPSNFYNIRDPYFRRWALHLHRIWRDLTRQVKTNVRDHQDRYSLLYVPYPFVIPGGRFREFYYWDTYWIVKGLLYSQMYETAKGIIRNFIYIVEKHGFIPNGGRVYYLSRTQPPFLTQMVYSYYLSTGDLDFVQESLQLLEKEFKFWIKQRSTEYYSPNNSSQYLFRYFQYRTKLLTPRPESYREDSELAENLKTLKEKQEMWSNLASAAEAGWDFSTRWFKRDGPDAFEIKSIRTMKIVPVDLNALLCMNARTIGAFWELLGNKGKWKEYNGYYSMIKKEMKTLHWNETDGIWYDYDLETKKHITEYYISNTVPLYARCFDDSDEIIPHKVYDYLKNVGVLKYKRGLPTSLRMNSKEQWDKENAWPPMIHMLIEGFRNTGDDDLMKVAEEMAIEWINHAYKSYSLTDAMFEKYNVSAFSADGSPGSGGEYEVQTGFGWTNGVILDLLDKYGHVVTSKETSWYTKIIKYILGNAWKLMFGYEF
ncbi:Trehalase [Strongyloides ratti]|uniref:Trehalase n=1 Tax=Strongyloides ratti TaxID=34506 RepID=A0A090MY66_STRRB|nr:Trehalase [Strongyloides ratti]CEF66649.1 Trehalase [Strongyloides ratti]